MKEKIIIIIAVILLIIPIVLTAPPNPLVQTTDLGLNIDYPKNQFFYFNETITLQFHILNSTGHLVTKPATTCLLHIFNNTGGHILDNMSLNMEDNPFPVDFSIEVGRIFPREGFYPYLISCNNSAEGGFVSTGITLSKTGEITKETEIINYSIEKSIFTNAIGIVFLLLSLLLIFIGAADLGIKEDQYDKN